ncbi:MAG: tetratricopeptide repeat protein [Lachnospirales bacterium]
MREDNIRMQSSDPKLNSKIRAKVLDPDSPVYWYIKFNLQLDHESISSKSMFVTDLGGYVMNTYIDYNSERNLISITPLDTYVQEYYYVLNITTGVRSAKGTALKKPINILFKLFDDKISESQVLKDDQSVPKAIERTKNYDPYKVKSKIYGVDQLINESVGQDTLPLENTSLNPFFAGASIILLLISITTMILPFIIGSLVIAMAGAGHIIYQISRPTMRGTMNYNRGVKLFNSGRYKEAKDFFKKAWTYDQYNKKIEYALQKVDYFL